MATKGFSKNNPLDNLSNKKIIPDKQVETNKQTKEPEDIIVNNNAEAKEKKKPKYLRLDITEYQDYIKLMAQHESDNSDKYISRTQYILRLIEADKQKNLETYEKLEQIERMKRELM